MQGNGPILALALILALTLACGPENQGGPGPEDEAVYDRMYDAKTVETVRGEVVSVAKITDRGKGYGVSLTLKTNRETIRVYLGPGWFLEQQGLLFAPKDQVEITGSQITLQGKRTLIAAQVKKGGQSLNLRDPGGIPAWAGPDQHRASIIGKWLLQEMVETASLNILTRLPKKNGETLKYSALTLWNFTLLIRGESGVFLMMEE